MSEETIQPTSGAALRAKARPFITNPDTGNTYQVRKPTITDMIKVGVLPENFIAKSITAVAQGNIPSGELTDEDLKNTEAVRRVAVTCAINGGGKLRVVEHAEADDEIEYEDILLSDREYIHKWTKGETEGATVETKDGEVTQLELDNFSSLERQGEPDSTLGDSALLQ